MNKLTNVLTTASAPLLLWLLLCFSAVPVHAQEGGPPAPGEARQNAANQGGDLIRALALSPDQIAKIRTIRQQNREEQRRAGERLRNAQRALDEAIYTDNASEEVIEERARELAAAQTAVVRLRALTELGIRRVLTPDQLNTLRALRADQARQRRIERRGNPSLRTDDQPGGNDTRPTFPRDRFRPRQNPPTQQNKNSPPAVTPLQPRQKILLRGLPLN